MPAVRRSRAWRRTSSPCTSCSRTSPLGTPTVLADTPASSSSVRVARTRPRWCSSSWCRRLVTRLTLQYDGTEFIGWARQPGLRTVQEEVERVLHTVLGERLTLTVAGRTDRG